jgi:hypothetical protein
MGASYAPLDGAAQGAFVITPTSSPIANPFRAIRCDAANQGTGTVTIVFNQIGGGTFSLTLNVSASEILPFGSSAIAQITAATGVTLLALT